MDHYCQFCNRKYQRTDHFMAHVKICKEKKFGTLDGNVTDVGNLNNLELDEDYSLADVSMAFIPVNEVYNMIISSGVLLVCTLV